MKGFYCVEHSHGVKIGWSDDIDKRLSSHRSSGATMKLLNTIEYDDKKMDEKLKKIMKSLKLQVSVPDNKQSTEVYSITAENAARLFEYIKTTRDITKQYVEDLVAGRDDEIHTQLSYEQIRNYFGSRYHTPEYQRAVDSEHVEEIKTYIMENYNSRSFYLPPILLSRNLEDDERYSIIDGQHRCAAIYRIPKGHDCLKKMLHVSIFPYLPMSKQIHLFKSVNSCKPMPTIYIAENYRDAVKKDVIKELTTKYHGQIDFDTNFYETLFSDETLNKLIDDDIIQDLTWITVFNLIVTMNISIKSRLLQDDRTHDTIKNQHCFDYRETVKKQNAEIAIIHECLPEECGFQKIADLKPVIERLRNGRIVKKIGKILLKPVFLLSLLENLDFIDALEYTNDGVYG
jgi:hypothetical protein